MLSNDCREHLFQKTFDARTVKSALRPCQPLLGHKLDRQNVPETRFEALYLELIDATQRMLYIESQYFASRKIAEAITARLREADPPEFVIVNPESADGWLEEEVMGSSRARLLALIRKADHQGRFRLYTPVAEGGTPIYVHAKDLRSCENRRDG